MMREQFFIDDMMHRETGYLCFIKVLLWDIFIYCGAAIAFEGVANLPENI